MFHDQYKRRIRSAVSTGIINKELAEFLLLEYPRGPTFYTIYKIHKNAENPPGCPIISGIDSFTSRASLVISDYLQPFVNQLPSFLKDTITLLQLIETIQVPERAILTSIDVESLYSNIPHKKGIEVVTNFVNQMYPDEQQNKFMMDLLAFLLTHNYFMFGGVHYLQIQGVAMGTTCAPAYANLFLGAWEKEMLEGPLLECYTKFIYLYKRYIDDVLLIWTGPEQMFLEFVERLNAKH